MGQLLSLPHPPTAVLTSNDLTAIGFCAPSTSPATAYLRIFRLSVSRTSNSASRRIRHSRPFASLAMN